VPPKDDKGESTTEVAGAETAAAPAKDDSTPDEKGAETAAEEKISLASTIRAIEVSGQPVGRFRTMGELVDAARLCVQAQVASGATEPANVERDFALVVLGLLDRKMWGELVAALSSVGGGGSASSSTPSTGDDDTIKRWVPLLGAAGQAWTALPAERSTVFRAIALPGTDLTGYKRHLARLIPSRQVTWRGLVWCTLDRRVAMARFRNWDGAGVVFKIRALSARRMHGFSWLAGEETEPELYEALLGPSTPFQVQGLFELNEANLRLEVALDAQLAGSFTLPSEVRPVPLDQEEALQRRWLLVVLEELPARARGA
jgi:hypothetical protein